MAEKEGILKREIGVWGLSSNIVNHIVGAGIFVLPAIVAAGLGSASIIAYLFCGLIVALVMLCFAEVGSRITVSGGAYAYIETSFGKYAGFITSIIFLFSIITSDAAVANAIADILGSAFSFFHGRLIKTLFFIIVFFGLGYINIIGIKKGVGFVKIITAVKIVPLLVIVLLGFKNVSVDNLYWDSMPSIKNIGEMSLLLFFAFQGGETGLSISGELRNPKKTVPKAIQLGILFVLLFYILVQTVSQGILGSSLASFKENPLAEVASQILGPVGFTVITIGAGLSMFGMLSSEILSGPRILYAAATDNVIPFKGLALVHKKYATPYISIIVYVSLGLLFASAGGFKQLAIISSASMLLIYLGVSLATIKLRRTKYSGSETSIFKIPGGYTLPILSALVILWLLTNLTKNEAIGFGIFALVLTIIYLVINSKGIKQLSKRKNI